MDGDPFAVSARARHAWSRYRCWPYVYAIGSTTRTAGENAPALEIQMHDCRGVRLLFDGGALHTQQDDADDDPAVRAYNAETAASLRDACLAELLSAMTTHVAAEEATVAPASIPDEPDGEALPKEEDATATTTAAEADSGGGAENEEGEPPESAAIAQAAAAAAAVGGGGRGESGAAALFAREYAGGFDAAGWELWRLKDSDLERLGIPAVPSADAPAQEKGGAWARYSNDWGALYSTYPKTLVLPKACTTAEPALMTEVSSFRSKARRIPIHWHVHAGCSIFTAYCRDKFRAEWASGEAVDCRCLTTAECRGE